MKNILKQFIYENVRASFGLDRYVTFNALSDVAGDHNLLDSDMAYNMRLKHVIEPHVNDGYRAVDSYEHKIDALCDDLDDTLD